MKKLVKNFLMMVWVVSFAMSVHAQTLWGRLNYHVDALYEQGLYSEAARVAEGALKIAEEALKPDHPQVATALENMSKRYEKSAGEGEAEKVEESTKHIQSQVPVPSTEVGPQKEAAEDKKETKEISSKPQKPSNAVFTVQVGAFRNASYAKFFMTWLKEKGYDAYIATSMSKEEEKLYRVCIGIFIEREKAVALSEKIKNSEGLQTFVTSK